MYFKLWRLDQKSDLESAKEEVSLPLIYYEGHIHGRDIATRRNGIIDTAEGTYMKIMKVHGKRGIFKVTS